MQENYGQIYEQLYREHWWWRAREAILLRELSRLPLSSAGRVLDVGCGNGLFFPALARWGTVQGVEVDTSLLNDESPHRAQISTEPLGHPRYADWVESFDLITALDVVEHVEDDAGLVEEMVRLLKPGGYLLITVPAFMCLWDHHDEVNQHHRRYRARALSALCAGHGEVLRLRYLFPSLFAPKWLIAHLNRRRLSTIVHAQVPSSWSRSIMTRWLLLEDWLTRRLPLPCGSSVLAVLRKQPTDHMKSTAAGKLRDDASHELAHVT